jgi:hypothetical protein
MHIRKPRRKLCRKLCRKLHRKLRRKLIRVNWRQFAVASTPPNKNAHSKWEKPGTPLPSNNFCWENKWEFAGKNPGIPGKNPGMSHGPDQCVSRPCLEESHSDLSLDLWISFVICSLSFVIPGHFLGHFNISAPNPPPFQTFQREPSKTPAISTKRETISFPPLILPSGARVGTTSARQFPRKNQPFQK